MLEIAIDYSDTHNGLVYEVFILHRNNTLHQFGLDALASPFLCEEMGLGIAYLEFQKALWWVIG
jgi:hypothetical protein